jgi:SPP1 gp7 family putative phage head morphogenesis protein
LVGGVLLATLETIQDGLDVADKNEFYGYTGTTIYAGYVQEEALTELQGLDAVETWDEMRRGDGQIKMILSAIKNPIRSAKFAYAAKEDNEKSDKIADFLNYVLFSNEFFSFQEFLTEALTYLDFGFSVHEYFFKAHKDKEFGSYHTIGGLGFRKQATITRWLLNPATGLYAVEQTAYGDTVTNGSNTVQIPKDRVIILSNDKEGDNFEGISILRACYGPWFRKNLDLKLKSIGNEKAAIGIPCGKYPKGQESTDQRSKFEAMLSNFAIHESSYLMFPDGYDITVTKIDFDAEKLMSSIQYEDSQMAKSMLLQFLELGQNGSGGAYALGADQSDIALSSFQYIGEYVGSKLNEIAKKLVEINFGSLEDMPYLTVAGINNKAGTELANVLKTMIDARVIRPDDTLESYIRDNYNMPQAEVTREKDPKFQASLQKPDEEEGQKFPPKKEAKKELSELAGETEEKPSNGFRRPFTIYEKGINFAEIVKEFDFETDRLARTMRARVGAMTEKAMRDVEMILKKNPNNRVGSVADYDVDTKNFKKVLIEAMSDIVATGTEQAKRDLSAKMEGTNFAEAWKRNLEFLPRHVKNGLLVQANMQAMKHAADVKRIIAFGVMSGDEGNLKDGEIIRKIDEALGDYVASKVIDMAARTITSQNINRGRQGYMFDQENLGQIQAFQYSAVIDDDTTDICLSLDGKIMRKDDEESMRFMPPNHYGCRSILVPITINEEKPKATGLEIDPTNDILREEYERRGKTLPNLETIKKSRNL